MEYQTIQRCTAFDGQRRIAAGALREVARQVKQYIDRHERVSVLVFNDKTGVMVELDLRGTVDDVLKRIEDQIALENTKANDAGNREKRRPGRPKLGVVSREVTLLPRHWEWLNRQPGGASVTLRKLVEEARRVNVDRDTIRNSQGAAYNFMIALAGDLPGFEEVTRALFSGNAGRFDDLVGLWPVDIRDYARKLSQAAFQQEPNRS